MKKIRPVDFTDVALEGFWRERIETVLTRSIPTQYEQLKSHGILDSLRVVQPPPPIRVPYNSHNFTPQIFWDSDVGKWIEAASYALSLQRDPEIESRIDEIAEWLAQAQLPDGYLNCWYIGREIHNRWTNLRDNHELYCAGHMLEGAIAYFQATGNRRLLDIMLRYIEHIRTVFGSGKDQKRGYCGHQEIELALIKLYHLTGDRKHLELAAYFIDERGRQPHYFDLEAIARGDDPKKFWAKTYEYNQSHKPVREQHQVVGHAVRAMYMYSAMADLAAELDDDALKAACERLWRDVTGKRMYITAGLGPSAANEGFTRDYDLPNDTAYAETCASVALIFWAQRMLNLDLRASYADVLEQALYNGALSGLSRDGTHYFYENPLESDGTHARWTWHTCPCCTMNVSRLVASVGGYFYSTGNDVLAVHLYGANRAEMRVSETRIKVRQETDYPWSGVVRIEVDPEAPATFSVKLRVPGWAGNASVSVNGERIGAARIDGYIDIPRRWSAGDVVDLDLPMTVHRIYANPKVRADFGRACLKRGPLVYCVEAADNPKHRPTRARLPRGARAGPMHRSDLFDGVVSIVVDAEALDGEDWQDELYRTEAGRWEDARLTFIPYYLWRNRGAGEMQVWLPEC